MFARFHVDPLDSTLSFLEHCDSGRLYLFQAYISLSLFSSPYYSKNDIVLCFEIKLEFHIVLLLSLIYKFDIRHRETAQNLIARKTIVWDHVG